MLSPPFLMLEFYRKNPLVFESLPKPRHTDVFYINRLFQQIEDFLMPASSKSNGAKWSSDRYKFASVRLNDAQKAHFEGWLADNAPTFEDTVTSFVLAGHKISFSRDNQNDCYIASLTCNNERSNNFEKVMTSRASTWFDALMMCCYKSIVVCENGSWPIEKNENNWG